MENKIPESFFLKKVGAFVLHEKRHPAVCSNGTEQRRRPSRDASASPPPPTVQTQQPQSTHTQITATDAEQDDSVSSDAPPGDDICTFMSLSVGAVHHPSVSTPLLLLLFF